MEQKQYNEILEAVKNYAIGVSEYASVFFIEEPMNFRKTPEEVLKNVFGYTTFRPLQRKIIENVLEGRDTLAVLPTGGGKSLCYEIPALIMPGLTIVVSPLIALMQDQVAQLESVGVEAVYLNSSMDWDLYCYTCDRVRRGEIKLLYVSPEGLNTDKIQNLLHSPNVNVDCITIDEAHCISEWGHDFRPDYMALSDIRMKFPQSVCLALTATATKQVQNDITKNLKMEQPDIIIASFDRPNIFLQVEPKIRDIEQILEFLRMHKNESGIIYCFSRKQVDELTNSLHHAGIKVLNYHAGLSDMQRAKNQKAFIQDKADVMVATVAFGMGINKPDVRFVIHYDMPKSIEQYYQEIGRAGRDGLPSHALLLYSRGDARKIRYFFTDSADIAKSEKLLSGVIKYAETQTLCRRELLLSYFGEYNTVDRTKTDYSCCCDICASRKHDGPPKVILNKKSEQAKASIKAFPKKTDPSAKLTEEKKLIASRLRDWRKKTSEEINVPPYIIFGDKTLYDIAEKSPKNAKELLNCYGIGESKAEKFGQSILKIVSGLDFSETELHA